MGKGINPDTDIEDSTEMTLKDFQDSEMTLKDLLDLDLSLYDGASTSTYMSATFDSDTIEEDDPEAEQRDNDGERLREQNREYSRDHKGEYCRERNGDYSREHSQKYSREHNGEHHGESKENRSMLHFIKQMMARERDAKYDMIETLHEQIVLLKEQLSHKQGIIDSLLDAHCNKCTHTTAPNNYTLPMHPNTAQRANTDTLLGVKTLIEDQLSRNVAQVEYHTASPKRVKSLRPVSEILTDIRDLIEHQNRQPAVEEQKSYRIHFKLDGHAMVEEQTTMTPCKMRFVN